MDAKEFIRQKMRFCDALNADNGLTRTAHGVARQLVSKYLNRQNQLAWPSAETLANDLNVSVRSVRRDIRQLTQPEGWFIKVQGGRCGRSKR